MGEARATLADNNTWTNIKPEAVARMRLQNRFRTGLDIARYTAKMMRKDMAEYDMDNTKYTQSLGCWHGFVAQQKLISVKKHFGTTEKRYIYLSGWMIAAMRSEFGPLPDQSMHEKTAVPALIGEIYTFLRQADARELNKLFRALDKARKEGDKVEEKLLMAKINAVRYAFLELGVEDGVILARTDSLGAGLTQKIPVSKVPGDLASQYNDFLLTEEVAPGTKLQEGDLMIKQNGKLVKPVRLPNGLYKFREGTAEDRVILDCVTSLQHGADLLWIETPIPNLKKIASLVAAIRAQAPTAKLCYNNSPSFNWTLSFRKEVYEELSASRDMSIYDKENLMDEEYDDTELGRIADERIQSFQADSSQAAGIFHHLITLPTYHTAALSTDYLAKGYFGPEGMLSYVRDVQRQEIRIQLDCVKHQDMAGTYLGDDHKQYFSGDAALKAGGKDNTMNQFEVKAKSTKKAASNGVRANGNGIPAQH